MRVGASYLERESWASSTGFSLCFISALQHVYIVMGLPNVPTSFITCLTKVITDTRDCGVPKIRLILLLCKKKTETVSMSNAWLVIVFHFLKINLVNFYKLITTIERIGYNPFIKKKSCYGRSQRSHVIFEF